MCTTGCRELPPAIFVDALVLPLVDTAPFCSPFVVVNLRRRAGACLSTYHAASDFNPRTDFNPMRSSNLESGATKVSNLHNGHRRFSRFVIYHHRGITAHVEARVGPFRHLNSGVAIFELRAALTSYRRSAERRLTRRGTIAHPRAECQRFDDAGVTTKRVAIPGGYLTSLPTKGEIRCSLTRRQRP